MPSIHSAEHGSADVVIGTQYGDEGKGRFVDGLAEQYDWVARFNGGPNAGHTVEAEGRKLALHQIPSGVVHPGKKLFVGSQCVVNMEKLLKEMEEVEAVGLTVRDRLRISSQASIIQPGHVIRDLATMKAKVGTTGNGIGPAYADQASRVHGDRQLDIRLGDLVANPEWAFARIRENLQAEIDQCGITMNVDAEMNKLARSLEQIAPLIEKDPQLLLKEIRRGMKVLLEGAQAFGLDKTFGATPDVTASNTGVAAAFVSTGIPVYYKGKAYGVAKLIPSRVGFGPFVSEFGRARSEEYCMAEGGTLHTREFEETTYGPRMHELLRSADPFEVGIALRMRGGEYGATTGRPRRLGVFDPVQVGNVAAMNGLDGMYLTKADVLSDFALTNEGRLPLVRNYAVDKKAIDYVPTTGMELRQVEPVYEDYPAFSGNISHIRTPEEMPQELQDYLHAIRQRIDCDILAAGVGPKREQVVELPANW